MSTILLILLKNNLVKNYEKNLITIKRGSYYR